MPKKTTLFERIQKKLYNNKVSVIIIFVALFIAGLSSLLGNLKTIQNSLFGQDGLAFSKSYKDRDNNLKENDRLSIESMPTEIFYNGLDSLKANVDFVRITIDGQCPWKEWSEGRFAEAKTNYLIENPSNDILMERRYYKMANLSKAQRMFDCERFKHRVDPNFDITISNNENTPLLLLSVGIEVQQAGFRTISGGDENSNKIFVKGKYSVDFPLPRKVIFNNFDNKAFQIDIVKNNINFDGSFFSIDTSIKQIIDDKNVEHNSDEIQMSEDYEYGGLPIIALVKTSDPVLIETQRPFRFTLKINHSERFKTDALIRFVIKTDKGISMSEIVYLVIP